MLDDGRETGVWMTISDDRAAGTLDTGRFMLTRHEFEPGRFDFKEVLSPTRA
jgi:hypothetical protein